ncbi:ABC transporter permease subunit [Candidatus Fermentibacteria bacterium]|nr:ABC transporter permease subunit [Candidatus Fermentibacteria bacterium]
MRGLLTREWLFFKGAMGKAGLVRYLVIYVGIFGLFIPSQIGHPSASLVVFGFLPIYVAGPAAVDAIAGERERKTLETLLSAPVEPTVVLAGKALFSLLFSLASAWIALVLYEILQTILGRGFPTLNALLFSLTLGVLTGALSTLVGLNVSLRASSARSAQQWYSIVLIGITVGLPFGLKLVLDRIPQSIIRSISNLFAEGWFSTGSLITLAFITFVCLVLWIRLHRQFPRLWCLNEPQG